MVMKLVSIARYNGHSRSRQSPRDDVDEQLIAIQRVATPQRPAATTASTAGASRLFRLRTPLILDVHVADRWRADELHPVDRHQARELGHVGHLRLRRLDVRRDRSSDLAEEPVHPEPRGPSVPAPAKVTSSSTRSEVTVNACGMPIGAKT